MAVPTDPTTTTICTEALKIGGVLNPSSAQVTAAIDNQLADVKSDVRRVASRHPLLKTTAVQATVVGQSRYSQPADADAIQAIQIWDGPDTWRGTAQAGASTTLTFAASFNESTDTVKGKFLVTTGGLGSAQYRQVTGYNNTTKVATVESAWTTTPDSTTTYLLVDTLRKLFDESKPYDWDYRLAPWGLSIPRHGALEGESLWLDYAPDKVYVLHWNYWADLDRLDESGTVFVKLLREWRSLWIQGVAAYTARRYDDDRFVPFITLYQAKLDALSPETCAVGQGRFTDV
jgi:hypothetical protein